MEKTITLRWLKEKHACDSGVAWYQKEKDHSIAALLDRLMAEVHYDWANWLVSRLMTKKQCVAYAVYAAEQVIEIYESKYPDDKRPRQAIEAAKAYLHRPSKNAARAAYAAYAAHAAAHAAAAYAAYAAADAAADAAAYAAAHAAHAAAHAAAAAYAAADAAAYAADAAAYAAYAAAYAAADGMKKKILTYGIGIIFKKEEEIFDGSGYVQENRIQG